jgi:hypothetical protein
LSWRDAVRSPHRQAQTPKAAARPFHARFRLHRREAAEKVPVCVREESQRIRAAVAVAVAVLSPETLAIAPPQPIETLRPELLKQLRDESEDQ